jgi:hypothetical protein
MKLSYIFIFFLLSSVFCGYKKLSKYGSAKVVPDTKVYLDLSKFNDGDCISFEIKMDLFFDHGDRSTYRFQIDQVPANNYYESYYWDNLRTVDNRNYTVSGSYDYKFTWDEIKRPGNNYIFIILPTPFDNYAFFEKTIYIKNTGGLSTGAIVGIVLGVCIPVIIIVLIIVFCCCRRKRIIENNYTTSPILYSPPVQTNVVYQQPVYQQPGYQPGYQQPGYQQPLY